ncbi:dihydrofolate reductase family protein [Bradyrhizobium sp. AZCC 2289]|uniref:dihydrofolate reductase family protein n=1 Tax=Bradyrhizobium sp. AZCC 2289 TaxID=3117026 RepID=UPI002FF1C6EF
MGKVRASAFSVSLDGFGAGPNQDLEHPFGVPGIEVTNWMRKTRMFHEMIGQEGGTTDTDDHIARTSMENLGAWIMGRNMFGPIRGQWPDHSWKGWWGDNPPYHVPVFVLTHHPRPSIEMAGGTVFHFVTDGIEAALKRAADVAGGKDVRIGGGVSVVRQYLQAGLLDELHLAVSPVLLGRGENLFAGLDLPALGFVCAKSVAGANATHVTVRRRTAMA